MAGVEFVPDEPDPHDPAAPAEPAGSPRHRRIAAGLIAIAVAALAAWVVTRPSTLPTAEPGAVRTVLETATSKPATRPRVSAPVGSRTCHTGAQPDLVRSARTTFPTAQVLTSLSYICALDTPSGAGEDRVVSASVALRVGKIVIEAQASRRVGDSGQYVPAPAGGAMLESTYAQSAALEVSVVAYGRAGARAPSNQMQTLAENLSLFLVL